MFNLFSLLEAATPAKSGSTLFLVVIYGAFFAFMWFVLIRPQRKKQKAVGQMQSTITIGQWILTSGGLYGKVVDTVNDNLIVEFGMNKGVRVPVQRSAVASVTEPDLTVAKITEES
ncbi:MAG: preprotein translocase subunit YajC [Vallitaleaceae bacterium]|nr:preprotein translocase subunit YajC [Vallitaleaceae bacterium]